MNHVYRDTDSHQNDRLGRQGYFQSTSRDNVVPVTRNYGNSFDNDSFEIRPGEQTHRDFNPVFCRDDGYSNTGSCQERCRCSNPFSNPQRIMRRVKEPDRFDGKVVDWKNYIVQFEEVAHWNGWR